MKKNNILIKNLEYINLFFKPYDLIRTEVRNHIQLLNSNNEYNMVSNNFKSFYRIPNNLYGKFVGFFLDLRKSYNYIIDCGLKSDLLISKTLYLRNYIDSRLLFQFEKEIMIFNDNFSFNYNNLDYIKTPYIKLRKEMEDRLAEKTVDLNEFGLGNDNIFYNDNFGRAFYIRMYDYNFSSPLLDYKNKAFFYYKFIKGDYTNLISQNSFRKKIKLNLISERANSQIINRLQRSFFLYYTFLLKQSFCFNSKFNINNGQFTNNNNFNSKFIIDTNTFRFATIKKLYMRNLYFIEDEPLDLVKLVLMEKRSALINKLLQQRLKYKIFKKLKKKLRLHLLSFYRIARNLALNYNFIFNKSKVFFNSKQTYNFFYLNLWNVYSMRAKVFLKMDVSKKISTNILPEKASLLKNYYYNIVKNINTLLTLNNNNFLLGLTTNKKLLLRVNSLIKKEKITKKKNKLNFTLSTNNKLLKEIKKEIILNLFSPVTNLNKFINNTVYKNKLYKKDTAFYEKFLKIEQHLLIADAAQKKAAQEDPSKEIIPIEKLKLIVFKRRLIRFYTDNKFLYKKPALKCIKKFSLNYLYFLTSYLKQESKSMVILKKDSKFKNYVLINNPKNYSYNKKLYFKFFQRNQYFNYWLNGIFNDYNQKNYLFIYKQKNIIIDYNNIFFKQFTVTLNKKLPKLNENKNARKFYYNFNSKALNSYDRTFNLFKFIFNNPNEYKYELNNKNKSMIFISDQKILISNTRLIKDIFIRMIKKISLAYLIKSRLFNFLLRFNLDMLQFTNFSLTFFKRLKYLLKFVYKFSFYYNLFNFIINECKLFYFKLYKINNNTNLELAVKKDFLCTSLFDLIKGKQILKQLILQIKMYLTKSFLLNSFSYQMNNQLGANSFTLLNSSYLSLNIETFFDLYLNDTKYKRSVAPNNIYTIFSETFQSQNANRYSKINYIIPLITYYKFCLFRKRFLKSYSQNGLFKYNIYTVFILCYLKF